MQKRLFGSTSKGGTLSFTGATPARLENPSRRPTSHAKSGHRSHDAWYPVAALDVPRPRLRVAYARPTQLERMAVMSPTRRDRSWDRHRDVRLSVHLQRVPRTIHRRPRRGGRSSTSRRQRGLRGRHRDPDGCHRSAVAARASSSTFGRTRRPRVANTPRTWQRLSCPLLSAGISPTRPDRPRRCSFLRSRSKSSRTCSPAGSRASSAPSTGLRCPSTSRISWRRGLARRLRRLRNVFFGSSTGCLCRRCPFGMTSPRVPSGTHPRPRLSWLLAPPPRRLARAFAGPSPAPSPNPRTVRLSASRLPSLTARQWFQRCSSGAL